MENSTRVPGDRLSNNDDLSVKVPDIPEQPKSQETLSESDSQSPESQFSEETSTALSDTLSRYKPPELMDDGVLNEAVKLMESVGFEL